MQEYVVLPKNPLISFLTEEKILEEGTLLNVIDKHEKTGQSLITILKKEDLLDEEQLTKVVASTSGIEFVNLAPEMVEPMVAHLVPYEMASRHNVIPIKREDGKLRVAMSSPLNLSVRDQIEMKTGYKVIPVAATPTAIKRAVRYHFDVTNVTKQAIVSMRLQEGPDLGIADYVTKPVDFTSLLEKISNILGNRVSRSVKKQIRKGNNSLEDLLIANLLIKRRNYRTLMFHNNSIDIALR